MVYGASPTPVLVRIGQNVNSGFPEESRSHLNEEDCSRDVAGSRDYRRRSNRCRARPTCAADQTDAAAKVSGLEAFVTQYPNSVMKEDALELLMGAYQQMLGQAKTPDEQRLDQTKTLD